MERDNKKRWEILDSMLQSGPVTAEEIYERWNAVGIITANLSDENASLSKKYSLTLRQDLFRLKQIYKEAGYDGDMLAESENQSRDGRKKTFKYAESGFSLKDIINSKYTKSNWANLDRNLDAIRSSIPESMARKVDFFVYGRINELRGEQVMVDWSEKPGKAGTELAPELFYYIRKKQPVKLVFSRIKENSLPVKENLIFHPYLLKVYRGRWYCLGYEQVEGGYRTIALDRIALGSLIPIDCEFRPYNEKETGVALEKYYSDVIGVTKDARHNPTQEPYISDGNVEIVLGVHDLHSWNYFITNPMHNSSEVLNDYDTSNNYGRVKMTLKTNFEFYKSILYLGPAVEVEKPEKVRDIVKGLIAKSYENYFGV